MSSTSSPSPAAPSGASGADISHTDVNISNAPQYPQHQYAPGTGGGFPPPPGVGFGGSRDIEAQYKHPVPPAGPAQINDIDESRDTDTKKIPNAPFSSFKIWKFNGYTVVLFTVGVLCCAFLIWAIAVTATREEHEDPLMDASNWTYGHLEGPPQWGGTCKDGKQQSPIDLPLEPSDLSPTLPLSFNYQTSVDVVVKDTGHGTMNVNFPAESPSTITVAGKAYTLLQCHFHTSSEHTVEGVSYLGEAHFVHQAEDGSLAVVGIFIDAPEGQADNTTLATMLQAATVGHSTEGSSHRRLQNDGSETAFETSFARFPADTAGEGVAVSGFNPTLLMPAAADTTGVKVWHYKGSLTTPPCTEGLEWFVLQHPVMHVSARQVLQLQAFFSQSLFGAANFIHNYRPVNDLNGRSVTLHG